eukprot:CAMPEP_0182432586 /NCGR_PEP_ID=MMETSP1167-20130531/57487_1 /TAXON_ID=2988 /ORGANISM="Mallomonas Sp, Strain CCMP3275" /LENGTH=80 /DNA_ID=CAMNT_0024620281 /DNA_START=119 /DNA_END=361 /DNA_ORIENTATION=-
MKLGEAGACEVVVQVLKQYMSVPEVVEQACGAVLNLSFTGDNKAKLRSKGAKKLMASILEDKAQNSGARYWAKNAFTNLY